MVYAASKERTFELANTRAYEFNYSLLGTSGRAHSWTRTDAACGAGWLRPTAVAPGCVSEASCRDARSVEEGEFE